MHKDALLGRGQISRQGIRSELACLLASGRVETDLIATRVEFTEIRGAQSQVVPGFQ